MVSSPLGSSRISRCSPSGYFACSSVRIRGSGAGESPLCADVGVQIASADIRIRIGAR
jgi:hypothetical protein